MRKVVIQQKTILILLMTITIIAMEINAADPDKSGQINQQIEVILIETDQDEDPGNEFNHNIYITYLYR